MGQVSDVVSSSMRERLAVAARDSVMDARAVPSWLITLRLGTVVDMQVMWSIVGLVLGVLLVTAAAARVGMPAPILLVIVGVAVSIVPGVPGYQLEPEVVLAVLLPPLLYGAAFESSAVAIRRLLRPIVQLSVLLVLLTAFTVALVLHLVVPQVPFGAALALGAIVAPPDAVAAIAVARKVGMPRDLLTVLEGESLFNDATSLVTLKVAIATFGASSIGWLTGVGEFAWATVGGVLVGSVLGLALSLLRRHVRSPILITATSLVSPFAAYLVGEAAHASGVLAVVVTGLVLGYRSPGEVPASVRLTETAAWAAIRFVLEGSVFALIGLQLLDVMRSLDTSQGNSVLALVSVFVAVVVSRPIWLLLIHTVYRIVPGVTSQVGRRGIAALSWSGMRGVVSLAAAQTLPLDTPFRSLLLAGTIVVIVGTLIAQGLTLPLVVRRLGLAENTRADELRERADAHAAASARINERVDELVADERLSERQAELMRKWAALRDWRNWDDDEKAREFGHRLSVLSDWRRALLTIERDVMVEMRNGGDLSEDVLREMQHELDLEEALLERRSQSVDGHLEELPAATDAPDESDESDDPDGVSPTIDADPTADRSVGVDDGAAVDDADVSTLLLDEQRADGDEIGHRAGRTET